MRALIAGNWKMNGTSGALAQIDALARWVEEHRPAADVLICPPFTLIARAAAGRTGIAIGAQDCHPLASGAFTGDVSAEMVADAGATAVILGHSERRQHYGETDAAVAAKARAAWRAGLHAIICVGETEAERDAGRARNVVGTQLALSLPDAARAGTTTIAYEPVWAIGTGRIPDAEEIVAMHGLIRNRLEQKLGTEGAMMRILYGGSVKPSNARAILALPHVNGALVGGASLTAADFQPIIAAAPATT